MSSVRVAAVCAASAAVWLCSAAAAVAAHRIDDDAELPRINWQAGPLTDTPKPTPGLAPDPAPTPAPAPSASPAERAELDFIPLAEALQTTLRSIEAAVLTADAEAYLAWIDPSEPHFAREQRNWAADLKRHRPQSFELRVLPPRASADPPADPAAGFAALRDDSRIRCELEISWSFPAPPSPPDKDDPALRRGPTPNTTDGWSRTVRFPAVFKLVETSDPPRWCFAGEDWLTLRSADGRNTVCYAEGFEESAKRVLETLPTARARVDRLFGVALDHEQVVKLYPDADWLLASIYLSYRDPIGGWNEPGESIKLLGRRIMREGSTLRLLAHEYGHVVTFVFDDTASDAPWWAVEGVAEVCAFVASRDQPEAVEGSGLDARFISPAARSRVRAWHKSGALAHWDRIADFRKTPPELGGQVYKQGEHMVGFIGETFGRRKMLDWIEHLARRRPLDEATRLALDIPFTELDRRWRESIALEAEEQDP